VARAFEEAVTLAAEKPAEGQTRLAALAERHPTLAPAQYNAARARHMAGDHADAELAYRRALAADPGYAPAITGLANLYLWLKKPAGAERVVYDAITRSPKDLALRNLLVKTYIAQSRLDAAIAESKKVLKADEKNAPAMVNMATAFMQQGKLELAQVILEAAANVDPREAEALQRLGFIHLKNDDRNSAIRVFEEAVRRDDHLPEAHNSLGVMQCEVQDFEAAARHFRRALELNGGFHAARLNYASAVRGLKRYADAERLYRQVIDTSPELKEAGCNLGLLLLDNEMEGRDLVRQFEESKTLLTACRQVGLLTEDDLKNYVKQADKKIKREQTRRDKDDKDRKKKEAAERDAQAEAEKRAREEDERRAREGATPPATEAPPGAATPP
jgi:tetratricopeptide (TPR) repeat protein